MTPEIRRAALRAAAKAALVLSLGGCGGDPKPPPRNVKPADPPPPVEVVEAPKEDPIAKQGEEALAQLAKLQTDLDQLDKRVGEAVDAVVAAQNDADRAAAKARLEQVRKDKAALEQQVVDAKASVERYQKMSAMKPCLSYLDTLKSGKLDELAADDPLKGRHDVYGAFVVRAEREAPKTQQCCNEEMTVFGSSAKHRWQCCSALKDLPAGASPSACTPWGPPCPPEMPATVS